MVNLAEAAAAAKALTDRAEATLASECVRAAAIEFLAALYVTTPVRTGALRASEHVFGISGGGAFAVAEVGSDLVYARFRNDGGTITRHGPGSLGTPEVGFFGHSVTQKGSRYFERAEAEARGPIAVACRAKLAEIVRL